MILKMTLRVGGTSSLIMFASVILESYSASYTRAKINLNNLQVNIYVLMVGFGHNMCKHKIA